MAISDEISRLQTAKNAIKMAINLKGVTVPDGVTLSYYDTYISQIETQGLYEIKQVTPNAVGQTVTPSAGFDALSQVIINGDLNLVPENIANGVTIFGVTGTFETVPALQEKSVTPSASFQEIVPDSGYNGLSKVNVAGDSNLVSSNIRFGVRIFNVVGNMVGGNEDVVNPSGFLPLPVSQLNFYQTINQRGKGTVTFIFPDNASAVDLLIKENGIPEALDDYTQKIELLENTAEIILQPNENNEYARQYGMFAISKNEHGFQTALNNTNRKLFNLLYAGRVMENSFTSTLTFDYFNNTSYSLVCYRFDNIVFGFLDWASSNNMNSYNFIVLDLNTNTMKHCNIATGRYRFRRPTKLTSTRFILNASMYAGYSGTNTYDGLMIYDFETNTVTPFAVGSHFDYAKRLEISDTKTFFQQTGSESNINLLLVDKPTETVKTITNMIGYDVIATTQGIFARKGWTSGAVSAAKKFDETSETFNDVPFMYDDKLEDNEPWINTGNYYSKIYEDKYGTVWLATSNSSDSPWYYDGSCFVRSQTNNNASANFYNPTIFMVGDDECFVSGGKLYKFNGNNIVEKASGFPGGMFSRTCVSLEQDGVYYMLLTLASGACYLYKLDGNVGTQLMNGGSSDSIRNLTKIDNTIYVVANSKTYMIENGEITEIYSYSSNSFQKINGEIYAFDSTGKRTLLKLVNGTFQSITSSTYSKVSLDLQVKDNLIFIVPTWTSYSSDSSEEYVKYYNTDTGELFTTAKRIKYPLGDGYYFSRADKKVYNFVNDTEEDSILTNVNKFSYNTNSKSDFVSDFSMVLQYVNSTSIKTLFLT